MHLSITSKTRLRFAARRVSLNGSSLIGFSAIDSLYRLLPARSMTIILIKPCFCQSQVSTCDNKSILLHASRRPERCAGVFFALEVRRYDY